MQVNKLYAPHIGGVEKVVQDIAEGLKDKVDMKVLVCRDKGKSSVDNINGVDVIRAGSLGIYMSMPLSLSFLFHLRRLVKDRDIVHFHMPFPLADFAFFLSGFKGKVVLWWHSDIVRQKFFLKVYKPIMNRLLKRADRIIVATEGHITGSKYLRPFMDKCVIIPFGYRIQPCRNESGTKEIANCIPKPERGIKSSTVAECYNVKKILFVGRLVYYKGVDVLLDAFSKVRGAKLYIAGDGPLRPELEKKAADLGIKSNVLFLGHVDDERLSSLLNECDMLVLPSVAESEAFGLVQIEAMACSKPVINTSLPTGVPFVSLNEETGLTVPPGDAFALACAMQRLIDNDAERIQFGKNAKKRAEEYFNMDKMLDNIYSLYRDISNK